MNKLDLENINTIVYCRENINKIEKLQIIKKCGIIFQSGKVHKIWMFLKVQYNEYI
jgi:hypothetical protein